MRFSDIVKNKDGGIKQAELPAAKTSVVLPEAPSSKSAAPKPAINLQEIEKEIHDKIEQEFREKIAQIESRNREFTEEKNRQAELQQSMREKLFQDEQQKLQKMMHDLQKSRDEVNAFRLSVEQEVQKKIEDEKQRLEKDMRRELELGRKKIAEMEDRIRKQTSAEPAPRAASLAASPQSPPELPKPAASQSVSEPSKSEIIPRPRPKSVVPPAFKSTMVTETDTYRDDPEAEAKARLYYHEAANHAEKIFDAVAKKENWNTKALEESLAQLVAVIQQHESDLISLALEPYPEENYFHYHAINCAVLSAVLALDFNLTKSQLEHLALAAALHDIGLIGVRENLDYPKELSAEIKKEILNHPKIGSEMVAGLVGPEIQTTIAQHHEACNGKGYPLALDEPQICLEAKILNVVDAFEAMTHQRPYRQRPLSTNEAVKDIIERGRGFYDRAVMKSLMSRIGLYPVTSLVVLSNKQIARVVCQNRQFPMSPVVRVEFDEFGNKLKTPFVMDLVKNQLIHIVDPVTSAPSYAQSHMHRRHESRSKGHKILEPLDFVPYVIMLVIGALLVYLVLKI